MPQPKILILTKDGKIERVLTNQDTQVIIFDASADPENIYIEAQDEKQEQIYNSPNIVGALKARLGFLGF